MNRQRFSVDLRENGIPFVGCIGEADPQVLHMAGPGDVVISRDNDYLIWGCEMAWLLPSCDPLLTLIVAVLFRCSQMPGCRNVLASAGWLSSSASQHAVLLSDA